MHDKSTHDRRQIALQFAGGITAFALVVWVTTLGVRFATATPAQVASGDDTSQAASVVESQQGNATLIVATSSDQY